MFVPFSFLPAQEGIQDSKLLPDPRFNGDDELSCKELSYSNALKQDAEPQQDLDDIKSEHAHPEDEMDVPIIGILPLDPS